MSGHNNLCSIPEALPSPSLVVQPNKLIINVGGTRFETYKSTLRNIPDTRLSWITESKADNPDYDPVSGEYFFDRHSSMFRMILNYYRTGKLHTPSDVCGPAFEEELLFWGIDEKQIESCCWGSYCQHRDAQQTLEELKIDTNFDDDNLDPTEKQFGNTAEKFGIMESEHSVSTWDRIKPKLWSILNNGSASKAAKVFTSVSLVLTITVITTFILETHPCCRIPRNASEIVELSPFSEYREKTTPHPVLYYIEMVCMLELTAETIVRLVSCPVKKLFFKNALNVFDLISLLSFYITSILFLVDGTFRERQFILLLQVLRLSRVLRIFKVATHLPALKILFHTLRASAMELMLMLVLIISLIVIFASTIYFAEQIQEVETNDFVSIPVGFWWAIVTMTTLGYGDKHPQTAAGYVVGSFCAICGVLFIALPIPIIVNNFSTYYTHAKAQEKLPKKKKVALVGAADALKQTMQDLMPSLDSHSPIMIISDVSSREASPLPSRHELQLHNSSKDTMKHSDDSGITGSTSSRERFTGGINVTFTDIDESEEIQEVTSKHHNNTGEPSRGQSGVGIGSNDSFTAEEDEGLNDQLITNNLNHKKKSQPNAVSRRASLLPGGVSNAPSPVLAASPKMLSTKAAAGPRERRRSLMPATYVGG